MYLMFFFPDMPPVSPTSGRVEGEVKLSVSYRNSTLFIMVMHIKDLVRNDNSDHLKADPSFKISPVLLPNTDVKWRSRPEPICENIPSPRPPQNLQTQNKDREED